MKNNRIHAIPSIEVKQMYSGFHPIAYQVLMWQVAKVARGWFGSQSARGRSQKIIFQTSRTTGWKALYTPPIPFRSLRLRYALLQAKETTWLRFAVCWRRKGSWGWALTRPTNSSSSPTMTGLRRSWGGDSRRRSARSAFSCLLIRRVIKFHILQYVSNLLVNTYPR